MRKWLGVGVVLALVGALILPVTNDAAAGAARRTWTVIAGGGTRDLAIVSNFFHPRTIEVAVGDTVQWEFQGFHTVSFLSGQAPPPLEIQEGNKTYFSPAVFFPAGGKAYDGTGYVNSGVPPLDPSAPPLKYSLTFTKPGTYSYICLIHGPLMSGTVAVKARGTGSPAAVAQRARSAQAATIQAGLQQFANQKVERVGNTVVIRLIGNPQTGISALRFTPAPVTVDLGAIVTWKMADPFEIHTVTFLSGRKAPEFVLLEPQAGGPPKLLVNPAAAAPTGQKNYDGTGYVNSGILFPPGVPGNPPTSFTLSFLKAGRYEYVCLVHLAEGMKGTIIVR